MARIRSVDAHNRVLEAALKLFVERGIESTTMDALAATSGVSKATIYKHWPEGKEPLLMELLLLVVGIEAEVAEEESGDLFTDLAHVLNDKPRNARPDDQKRLMPQMVAYSVTHQEFGDAWRARVMERPRRRLRHILTGAMTDGRLQKELDIDVCLALLLGPMLYRHIFAKPFFAASGDGQSILGTTKSKQRGSLSQKTGSSGPDLPEFGSQVAEAFCRAFEVRRR
jgi:AcrR family transcriptional regulator